MFVSYFIVTLILGKASAKSRRASKLSVMEMLEQKMQRKSELKERELEIRKMELELQKKKMDRGRETKKTRRKTKTHGTRVFGKAGHVGTY